MQITPDLSLAFSDGTVVARPVRQWRGFSAEHIVVGSEQFAFERPGDSHYLAFHDMVVDDGEIAINGMATEHSRDWRRSVAFIPKGHATQGWIAPTSRRNSFTALYFEPDLISDELERRYAIATPAPFLFARPQPLQMALARLEALLLAPRVDEMLAETICLVAALEVFGIQADPVGVGLSERQLRLVAEFVDANLATSIAVADLARVCGLSRFHFTRAFKKATGVTPYAYVTAKRIARGRELLDGPAAKIEDIAALVGFPTSAQFRQAFRARMGCSARDYRRLRE